MKVFIAQSCLTLCNTVDCSLPAHGLLQAKILEWLAIPFSRASFWPRDQIRVSYIAGRFFYHVSHQGSPKSTDMSSHSFFQRLFLSQGSSPDPLHCRQILYHLSHQRSPYIHICVSAWVYVYIYGFPAIYIYSFPSGTTGKESTCQSKTPELGRFPGGGHGNPLQNSCLENSMDRRSLVGCSSWGGRVGQDWAHTHTNIQISESLGCILKTNTIFLNHLYISKKEFF